MVLVIDPLRHLSFIRNNFVGRVVFFLYDPLCKKKWAPSLKKNLQNYMQITEYSVYSTFFSTGKPLVPSLAVCFLMVSRNAKKILI